MLRCSQHVAPGGGMRHPQSRLLGRRSSRGGNPLRPDSQVYTPSFVLSRCVSDVMCLTALKMPSLDLQPDARGVDRQQLWQEVVLPAQRTRRWLCCCGTAVCPRGWCASSSGSVFREWFLCFVCPADASCVSAGYQALC